MSWDVMLFRFAPEIRSFDDLEQAEADVMLLLGERDGVRAAITDAFPDTDWADPRWGMWQGADGTIEFSLGSDDDAELTSVMLHVRAGDATAEAVARLAVRNGWTALDLSTSAFLDPDGDPGAGQRGWRGLRDRALGD